MTGSEKVVYMEVEMRAGAWKSGIDIQPSEQYLKF